MPEAAAPDFSDLVEGVIAPIPLDRLMLSTLNVRQTERAADVDSLAEDIAARGLKQNLVVVPAHFTSGEASTAQMDGEPMASAGKNVWEGRFEVIAGGRRFQAMQLLVQQERLSPTYPVPCMIEFRDQAAETSLSENLHRVAMNPADEFEAYRVIVERAKKHGLDPDPVAYCAKRFGVTVKHVNGRLRLATLAPEILDALRANEISLDSAKAYAATDDQALQLKVFEGQKKSVYSPHHPATVRGALRGATMSPEDALAKFVTLEAYLAAGGRLQAEMFMGTMGDQERLTDVALVKKLAAELAEPMVAAQSKKDGFASGLLAPGTGKYTSAWPKDPKGMERVQSWHDDLTKAKKKKCVGVYAIDSDGAGIEHIGAFRPIEAKTEAAAPKRDWQAEMAARRRDEAIEARAAKLAVPSFGEEIANLIEWPDPVTGNAVYPPDEGESESLVVVYIRVPTSEIEQMKAEAERQIDAEAAAEATEDEEQEA